MHGQPDVPLPEPRTAGSHNSGKVVGPPIVQKQPTPPPPEPAKDESNIGNKLLKKMGWNMGTGLGASGEGRVDPVYVHLFFLEEALHLMRRLSPFLSYLLAFRQTAMYAQGVGLGASKGKEVSRVAGLDYAGLAKESVSPLPILSLSLTFAHTNNRSLLQARERYNQG